MDWKIYDNLRKLRKEKNLTIEELSKKAGVSENVISNIENKATFTHSIDTIAKLALALDVTVEDFTCKSF